MDEVFDFSLKLFDIEIQLNSELRATQLGSIIKFLHFEPYILFNGLHPSNDSTKQDRYTIKTSRDAVFRMDARVLVEYLKKIPLYVVITRWPVSVHAKETSIIGLTSVHLGALVHGQPCPARGDPPHSKVSGSFAIRNSMGNTVGRLKMKISLCLTDRLRVVYPGVIAEELSAYDAQTLLLKELKIASAVKHSIDSPASAASCGNPRIMTQDDNENISQNQNQRAVLDAVQQQSNARDVHHLQTMIEELKMLQSKVNHSLSYLANLGDLPKSSSNRDGSHEHRTENAQIRAPGGLQPALGRHWRSMGHREHIFQLAMPKRRQKDPGPPVPKGCGWIRSNPKRCRPLKCYPAPKPNHTHILRLKRNQQARNSANDLHKNASKQSIEQTASDLSPRRALPTTYAPCNPAESKTIPTSGNKAYDEGVIPAAEIPSVTEYQAARATLSSATSSSRTESISRSAEPQKTRSRFSSQSSEHSSNHRSFSSNKSTARGENRRSSTVNSSRSSPINHCSAHESIKMAGSEAATEKDVATSYSEQFDDELEESGPDTCEGIQSSSSDSDSTERKHEASHFEAQATTATIPPSDVKSTNGENAGQTRSTTKLLNLVDLDVSTDDQDKSKAQSPENNEFLSYHFQDEDAIDLSMIEAMRCRGSLDFLTGGSVIK